jgi:hypothetical protein
MANDAPKPARYPLLETALSFRGLPLKGLFSVRDVAELFDVTTRTIQLRMKRGDLVARNLPGHLRFLAMDLELFLQNSGMGPSLAS